MMVQWFSVTVIFYIITFNFTSLTGSPYLNFFLGAVIEIPALFLGYIALKKLGRRMVRGLNYAAIT